MSDFWYDVDGEIYANYDHADINEMMSPVRCLRCHSGVYDLAAVTVTARYTDCSMWRTPCCDALVDDRQWLRASYEQIKKNRH